MTNYPRFALIVLGVAASAAHALGAPGGSPRPTSGYIETVRTGFDRNGRSVGDRRAERVRFSGRNTRSEEWIDDHLSSVSVTGDRNWMAYPDAGRILELKSAGQAQESYPERVRRIYSQLFKHRERGALTTVGKYPAWKYSWHEPARIVGDIGSSAQDLTYLLHASEDFPVVLESTANYEGGHGSRQTLVSFKLGEAVPQSAFDRPRNLKPIVPFNLPNVVFRLEWEKERASTTYGWRVREFDVYAGDGKQVSFTHRQELTDANGQVSMTGGAAQTMDYRHALQQMWPELQPPTWSTVKRTGRERALGMDADVLENYVQGLPIATYTVVDHPQLGTLSVRHSYKDENERGSISVKMVRVDAPPAS